MSSHSPALIFTSTTFRYALKVDNVFRYSLSFNPSMLHTILAYCFVLLELALHEGNHFASKEISLPCSILQISISSCFLIWTDTTSLAFESSKHIQSSYLPYSGINSTSALTLSKWFSTSHLKQILNALRSPIPFPLISLK